MATTSQTYNGDGSTTSFVFSVPYLQTSDVKVSVGGVDTTGFSISGSNVTLDTPAQVGSGNIEIRRETNNDVIQSNFQSGSALRASDFNLNFTQFQYVTQEAFNVANTALGLAREGDAVNGFKSAIDIANEAKLTANAASSVVGAAVPYTPVGTVGGIPANPSDGDRVEINDSTSIESFSPLTGLPANFTGSSELSVRLQYLSSNTSWNWNQYFVIDPDARYVSRTGGQGVTGQYLASDANGVGFWESFPTVTSSTAGFMTTALKSKLDGIEEAAEVNVQSDWNAVSGDALILNKPALSAVATSGAYSDLTNAPVVPVNTNQLTNGANFITNNVQSNFSVASSYSATFNGETNFWGHVNVRRNGNEAGQIRFYCESETNPHYVTLKAPPHSAGANYTIELPGDLGTNGQVLSTNGVGGTSWVNYFDGNYNNLSNKPTLFDGNYNSLTNLPSLSTVATTGLYSSLSGTPTLSTVASSGDYTDLTNKPSLATVATSGSYDDLTDKPSLFDGAWSSITNKPAFHAVATSGSYNDLVNKPSLFDGAYSSLTGKPAFASVATSGSYDDLSDKPTLFSGSYNDLSNLPTTISANNIATSANGTNTSYRVPFLSTNTGNASIYNDGGLTYNPSTNHLTCSGDITAFSDARLKTNITVIDNALSKVQDINGVTFNRTDLNIGRKQTGLIAQELQKVLPEAVVETGDGTLAVAYGNVVGLLVEAIKELKSEVEVLKNAAS